MSWQVDGEGASLRDVSWEEPQRSGTHSPIPCNYIFTKHDLFFNMELKMKTNVLDNKKNLI